MPEVQLSDFLILQQLGQGGFGKVFLAEKEGEGKMERFAIKTIRKDKLVKNREVIKSVYTEF